VKDRGGEKWRRWYQGKLYQYRGTYEECVRLWHADLARLEAEEDRPSHYRKLWEQVRDWQRANGEDSAEVETSLRDCDDNELRIQWRGMSESARSAWLQRFKDAETSTPETTTVRQAVDAYLTSQAARVKVGAISAGYYALQSRCLDHFARHVGPQTAIANITGRTLDSYHTALLQAMADGWTADYTAAYVRSMRSFIRWAAECDYLETLPKNIGSKRLTIETKPKKVKTFTNDELRLLLTHAPDRTRLFLLLMLNTGATQKDVSDLIPDEIDWKEGRIIRKRSKTADAEGVPEVSYPLWPETFALLKQYGNQSGDRVLCNRNGTPLWVEKLNGKKGVSKTDSIRLAYGRLVRRLKAQGILTTTKTLKIFRKTSPSRLENSRQYPVCARHFLGHAPRGVSDRSYLELTQDTFDAGVQWLRNEYGIANIKPVAIVQRKRQSKKAE
jgi:integrase